VTKVNVHQAKTQLSQLLHLVEAGEEVVIARSGKPVARLVAVSTEPLDRPLGLDAGSVRVAPDFDAPLPEELIAEFER
jgi:prevent-host-death family protein